MDNNFSDILNIFKRLAEAANPAQQAAIAIAIKKKNKQPKNEDSMDQSEHHPSGVKFSGYWKGTDKDTPKPGQGVGGTAESVNLEEELMAEWSRYVEENIMPTGATGPTGTQGNAVDAAKMNKEIQNAQQNLNKLKSAGVTMTTSPTQAAQSAVKMANNPQANPATGQGMDQAAKKTTGALGKSIEDLVATGSPAQVTQVANAIKQAKLGQK